MRPAGARSGAGGAHRARAPAPRGSPTGTGSAGSSRWRRTACGSTRGTGRGAPRPRDADVTEAAFLLELVGIAERAHVREDAVLEPGEEHDRELEALGRVQRHERDRARLAVEPSSSRSVTSEIASRNAWTRRGRRDLSHRRVLGGADPRDAGEARHVARVERLVELAAHPPAPAGSRCAPGPRSSGRPRARPGIR